jgi:hypothetical protein
MFPKRHLKQIILRIHTIGKNMLEIKGIDLIHGRLRMSLKKYNHLLGLLLFLIDLLLKLRDEMQSKSDYLDLKEALTDLPYPCS